MITNARSMLTIYKYAVRHICIVCYMNKAMHLKNVITLEKMDSIKIWVLIMEKVRIDSDQNYSIVP